ncbi:cytochrome P450 [Fischerella sp. FACHB-380]|nr:cytochrome P450 [Fischerella sp. FACHB-380]
MHRHAKYFDHPEVFQTERCTEDFERQLPKDVYISFGDGPRICMGKGFNLLIRTAPEGARVS